MVFYENMLALNNVSMKCDENQIVGVFGANSAGKSTMIRIICGILEQSYGKIWINGIDTQEKREELEQLVVFKTKKLEEQKKEILEKNEELRDQYTNLELLSKIGRDITANLTVESLLDSIYEKVNALMDSPILGFGILDREKNRLQFPFLLNLEPCL